MTNLARRLLCLVICIDILVGMSACSIVPTAPSSLGYGSSVTTYSEADFQKDRKGYETLLETGEFERARILRDRMINRIRLEIEINYRKFESEVYGDRAGFNTAGDFVELGLAGATALTGGAATKTILATVLTALKGSRLSVDKNWFREKTTEALVAAMQSQRTIKLNQIIDKMANLPANLYAFEEAWVDLVEFFYAGTIEGALLSLTADAGKAVVDAKEDNKEISKQRVEIFKATREEIDVVRAATVRLGQLARTKNTAEAKRILDELKVPVGPDDDVFKKLQEQIRKAPEDRSLIPQIKEAFKIK